jgi:catechol 2,3-dioxygenase-like lactoylglutathione lyase family enzyme
VTRILYLSVADDPETWARLGFTLDGNSVRVGSVTFVLEGTSDTARGITSWTRSADDSPIPATIDGLLTGSSIGATFVPEPTVHPNGLSGIDHLVVSTPDVDRTVAIFEDLDWECRRRREGAAYGNEKMRQAFFWLGDVIVEVVGPETVKPEDADKPAKFFGIALIADDLEATAAFFGEQMKPPIDAVQAGRKITTISSKAGSTLAIAVMNPHIKGSVEGQSE